MTNHAIFRRLIAGGNSVSSAAHAVGISLRTASRWRAAAPRARGRRPETARRARRAKLAARIARTFKRKGHRVVPLFPTAPRVAEELFRAHGIRASRTTVLRDLKSLGFRTRVRPRHPNLKNPEVRRSFTKIWRLRDPRPLIFSDEHYVSVNDNTHRTMLVAPGKDPLPREHQRRQNIPNFQIWAAIGVGWRSELVFFPKLNPDDDRSMPGGFRLNSASYVRRCLSKISGYLVESGKTFMQDGAKCHWAKNVREYFVRKGINVLEGYPSHSPDLNPIESVWALLDAEIAKLMPTTEAELKVAAVQAWGAISQAAIDAHVISFQSKCQKVYKNGGI